MLELVEVHILQGLPGSGKTSFARRQFGPVRVLCSADQFLVESDGVYRFSPERVREAHGRCLRAFVEALQAEGPEPIIVDNTNLTVAEMAPYVALAQAYGAAVRIWHLDAPADACFARQVHGVPGEAFVAMRAALSAFSAPAWWPERTRIELAAPASIDRAYLGITLRESEELAEARARACAELGLVPRTEAHVTVAFVGEASAAQCEALTDAVSPHVEDALAEIRFTGIGAAYEPAGSAPVLMARDRLADAHPHACVAWWSVAPSAALIRLREVATLALRHLGLSAFVSQPFSPHVTLGARGRAGIADEDFDIYSIEKVPTLGASGCPGVTRAVKLHVTMSSVLPASITCLRAW